MVTAVESLRALFFSDHSEYVFMQLTLPTFCCHKFVIMEESFSDLLRDTFEGKKNTICFWLCFVFTLFTLL